MNKGVIAFGIVVVAAMGLFFFQYFSDKASPLRVPPVRPVAEAPAEVPQEVPPEDVPEKPPVEVRPVPKPPEPVRPKRAGGVIEGRVLAADTDKPVTEFEVKFEKSSLRATASRSSDSDFVFVRDPGGLFRLEDVPAGRAVVVVRAAGFKDGSASMSDVVAGETLDGVVIRLDAAVGIQGMVTGAGGARVGDALVFLNRLPTERMRERAAVARSDGNGRFFYETDAGDAVTLVVWHSEYAPTTVSLVPEYGAVTEYTIVLGRGASIQGKVWLGREPAEGLQVEFAPQFDDLGFYFATETEADGGYRLAGLPSCDATLTVTLEGGSAHGARTRQWSGYLEDGETAMEDFEFSPADSVIEGVVTFDGKTPEHATLSLLVYTSAGEEGRRAKVGRDGTYRFEAVPAGPVSLTVDAEDADGRLGFDEERFRLGEGEVRKLDFGLTTLPGIGEPKTK